MDRSWKVAAQIKKSLLKEFPEWNKIILQLLYNRGILQKEGAEKFLFPKYKDLYDPFLFSDMKKAVALVRNSVKKKEKIVVYGDYDADGVTSATVLSRALKKIGGKVSVYIPDREKEGYGLNLPAVKFLLKKNAKLVITVDCGISNKEEVELLKKNGSKVIVTDHHVPPQKVPDCPIINPQYDKNYPFSDLAGVGVAFKFSQALFKSFALGEKQYKSFEAFEKWLLDLVAVGTIADCMPLIDENRILVKYGLIVLNKTKRPGLKALIKDSSLKQGEIKEQDVSFRLSPRINAAGRMKHANLAFALLAAVSDIKANDAVKKLNEANIQRQKLTDKIVKNIIQEIGEHPKEKVLFSFQEKCLVGVLGLVAGKITDIYNRPSFVMTEKEGKIIGSGRSIPVFNLIDNLNKIKSFFSHFGGHSQACGFTLKNKNLLEKFKEKFLKFAEGKIEKKDMIPIINIDMEISLKDITWELYDILLNMSPFGEGNPKPRFLTRNLKVFSSREVGQTGNHLKIFVNENLENSNCSRDCIGFGLGEEWKGKIKLGDKIDLVYEIEENHWNGNREIQLKIIDLKHSQII